MSKNAIEYDLAGVHFPTQTALAQAVKQRLAVAPLNVPFQSRLFRDIVNTLHPDVIAAQQRSTGDFIFLTWGEQRRRGMQTAQMFNGGKLLITRFEPLGEWRDVTVYPWKKRKRRAELVDVLRLKTNELLPRPTDDDYCAYPGCDRHGFDLVYHHIDPDFRTIAQECLPYFTDKEQSTLFGYSKFSPGVVTPADCVPADHLVIHRLAEIHSCNKWAWLCTAHHVATHQELCNAKH